MGRYATPEELEERHQRVRALHSQGKIDREIADTLGLSENTINRVRLTLGLRSNGKPNRKAPGPRKPRAESHIVITGSGLQEVHQAAPDPADVLHRMRIDLIQAAARRAEAKASDPDWVSPYKVE